MKVGERRKVMSKTILTELSPGFLPNPVLHIESTNPKVIQVTGEHGSYSAYVKALSPGEASLRYRSSPNMETRIIVKP